MGLSQSVGIQTHQSFLMKVVGEYIRSDPVDSTCLGKS